MKKLLVIMMALIAMIGCGVSALAAGTYTVKEGDVLWKIAKNHDVTIKNLVKWNNIKNPNKIHSGTTLIVSQSEVELKSGKNEITYTNEGEKIAAFVFLPENYQVGVKYPAVVISPPASGVKEQTAGLYAEKLSKEGFITLAFDPRGWGESEGHKSLFDPYKIARDAKQGINYIASLEQVDSKNIFHLGICMGAGIAAYESVYDPRVNALAMVSPYIDLPETYLALLGSEGIRDALFPAISAAEKYYSTGEDSYRKMVPETEEEIAVATPVGIGMRDYYLSGQPGNVPTWRNEQSLIGLPIMLDFSIFDHMEMFEALPIFVAYGEKAVSKSGPISFVEKNKGEMEVMIREDAGHFDLYWRPEHVDPIVNNMIEFFNKHMN